jgi:hypothetical protein
MATRTTVMSGPPSRGGRRLSVGRRSCEIGSVRNPYAGRLLVALAALCVVVCTRIGRMRDHREEARDSYVRACASCHGLNGRGDGPVARELRVPPADLTTLTARHDGAFPREFLISVVTGEREVRGHGTREMPVWSERFGTASGPEAAASLYARRRLEILADHVESLQLRP